jgi:TonB family protein
MARSLFVAPALAALLAAASVALAAPPSGAPALPAAQARLLAGGIDSLGRAHVAAAPGALVLRTTVPADVPQAALDAKLKGKVVVRVHVTRWGTVDGEVVVSGDPRLRPSALAAARWYLFAPPASPAWTTVTVSIDGTVDYDPLPLDILKMARDAERLGHTQAALDAWAGALNRCGTHPTIRNPWAIREHIADLQSHMKDEAPLRGESQGYAVAARVEQQRTVAGVSHADLIKKFEDAQRDLPWWDEPYQWNAASMLGCGRSQDAVRTLLVFRAMTRDTVSKNRAIRALDRIAVGDTLLTGEMLKREGRQFDSPADYQ